jgi:hypothetical protein
MKFLLTVPQMLLAFGHAVVIRVVAKALALRITAIFNIPCARHETKSPFRVDYGFRLPPAPLRLERLETHVNRLYSLKLCLVQDIDLRLWGKINQIKCHERTTRDLKS